MLLFKCSHLRRLDQLSIHNVEYYIIDLCETGISTMNVPFNTIQTVQNFFTWLWTYFFGAVSWYY